MQSIFLLYSGCETKSPEFFPWYSSNHQSGPHCPITVAGADTNNQEQDGKF